jgi:hypothetical protein
MVPDISTKNLKIKSVLKTLLNIFNELKIISIEKKKNIMEQNWELLYMNSGEHQKINQHFDELMKSISQNSDFKAEISVDPELRELKKQIRQKLMEYKEIESLNFKMLKDNLFVTKQKLEKIFNQKPIKDTYTKELKKEEEIWNNSPVIFNRLI